MMSLSLSVSFEQPESWNTSLTLLYRPLIGFQACTLYTLLYGLARYTDSIPLEDLQGFLQTTPHGLEEARTRLEEFELLRCYADASGSLVHLEVQPVLLPHAFLTHDIYRRLLFQAIGSEKMERLKNLLTPKEDIKEGLRDITVGLNAQRLAEDWSQQQETLMKDVFSDLHDPQQYDFDWGLFFQGMHNTLPLRLRSRENMTRIARLASIYGLDELYLQEQLLLHLTPYK